MPKKTQFMSIVDELVEEQIEIMDEFIEEEITPLVKYREALEKQIGDREIKEMYELEESLHETV